MTDQYDLPFDMTEYKAVREAFDALPEAQLPDSLSAAALFARMDAQAAEPSKKAPALDIRQLRRGMAIAACGVLVVAAYVGLSQAGMLGGKTNTALTAQDAAAPAASSAAAAEAAPEAAPEEEMFFMAGDEDAGEANALANGAPEGGEEAVSEAAGAETPASEKSKEESMADAAPQEDMLTTANPDIGGPLLTNPQVGAVDETPLYADSIPNGYTLLADTAQGDPEAALLECTGLTSAQLQKAALAELDARLALRLNCISVSDSGDGSFALDVQLFELAPAAGTDGYAGANLYRLVPAGDGYDLMHNAALIAHFAA